MIEKIFENITVNISYYCDFSNANPIDINIIIISLVTLFIIIILAFIIIVCLIVRLKDKT